MTTGNMAKKRHLDAPSQNVTRAASAQKMTTANSYMVRSHTKRNLLNQYNDDTISTFAKPSGKTLQPKRVVYPSNKGVGLCFI